MEKLLAVTGVSPWPPRGGFSLRPAHLLASLAAEWEITLVVAGQAEPGAVPWTAADPHRVVRVPRPGAWAPVPAPFGNYDPLRDAVNTVLARGRFQAALLWRGTEFLAFGRRDFPPTVADRMDCVTLERLRALRRRPASVGKVIRSAAYERRLARTLAATVVVGEEDARALRTISGSKTVMVIPNGVQAQATPRFEAQSPHPTVAFSGTLNYYPNVDAVTHFVRHVWPHVRRVIPDARLLIAGRTPSRRVLALAAVAGVEVRGEVPDMVPVLQEAWVAVAPMRLGTGVKNKVLEAWAVGRPVVLTPLATNGLELDDAMRGLVTKRWEDFGMLVVQLLSDSPRRQSLGSAALSWVRARHSWGASAATLSQLLRAVSAPTIV